MNNKNKDTDYSKHYFTVPNNEEGQSFLKLARKYVNRNLVKNVRPYGRGDRVKTAIENGVHPRRFQQNLPLEYAEFYSVYLEDRESHPKHKHNRKMKEKAFHLENENYVLKSKLKTLSNLITLENLLILSLDNISDLKGYQKQDFKNYILDNILEYIDEE